MSTPNTPGTPAWLRERNERASLQLLFEHGALTRNRISELSGLSKPTASQIVGRFEQLGIVEPVGAIPGKRGPNAVSYGVRVERARGVAIDVSEFIVRSSLVDAMGTEHPVVETEIGSDQRDRSADSDVRDAIEAACAAADVDSSTVQMVALSLPGSVDPRGDRLSFIDTLPGWPTEGIRGHLESSLGVQVIIENDVNLAAIAERAEGVGVGASNFALLWMGEGLGLAFDLGGALHSGAAGGAGEIGYLPVPRDAMSIDADARSLQDLLGEPAVIAVARAHGITGDDHQVLAALGEHPVRAEVLAEIARRAAVGIIPVLAILAPELVVLGGPVGAVGGSLLAELVRDRIEQDTRWHPQVISTAVPDRPVLRGARGVLVAQLRARLLEELSSSA